MRSLQTVHDRALYFGQVKADARIDHPVIDRFEAFEAGGVDLVDRAAHQDEMAHVGSVGNFLQHVFLQPARVEVGQALIDPDRQDMRHGEDLVPIDIAKMLCLGDAPDEAACGRLARHR